MQIFHTLYKIFFMHFVKVGTAQYGMISLDFDKVHDTSMTKNAEIKLIL